MSTFRFFGLALAALVPLTAAAQSVVSQGALPQGSPQVRELATGDVHIWTIDLAADDYVVVEVEQRNVDVVLRLLNPAATSRAVFDTPTGSHVTQQAHWIADTTGTWQVQLMSFQEGHPATTYTITLAARRPATELDREVAHFDSLLHRRLMDAYAADDFLGVDSLLTRMLDVAERGFGPEHVKVASVLNARSIFFMRQHRLDEARAALERALAIQHKTLGQQHLDVTLTLNNMASLAQSTGAYAQAESLYQQILGLPRQPGDLEHPGVASARENLAGLYHMLGRYAEAERLYQESLTALESLYQAEVPATATLLHNLAGLYIDQGRYAEAEPLLERALQIRELAYGPDHSDVANTLNSLAELHQRHGSLVEAASRYEQVLAIWTRAFGPEHSNVATALNNLAATYHGQARYAEADSLYRRALAIREAADGADHPSAVTALNNLALLTADRGNVAEADSLYQRAYTLQKQAFGPDHPDLAVTLDNRAQLYQHLGRYEEAEAFFREALRLTLRALGPGHPQAANLLSNLAGLQMERGYVEEADSLYHRALAIQEAAWGPDHYASGTLLNNLALLYHTQGRYRDVETMYRRALAIYQATYGDFHPEVAVVFNNLGLMLMEQGRYREAESMLQRALEIDLRTWGPDHYLVGSRYANRAGLYQGQGRYAEAEIDYQRALPVLEHALGPEHPLLATTLNQFGGLYIDQKRFDEAEPLLERALAIRRQAYGEEHPDVSGTLNDLAVLYSYQEQHERAETFFRQSLAIHAATLGRTSLNYVSGLNNLASVLMRQERYDEADALFAQGLAVFDEHLGAEHPGIVATLIGQAENDLEAGRPDEALAGVNRALERFDAVPGYYPVAHVKAYTLRARLHYEAGRLDEALGDMEEALDLVETLRPQAGGGEQSRAFFMESYARSYDDIVAWYLEADDPETALAYTERGRARTLLDQLNLAGIDLWDGLPDGLRRHLQARDADARARLAEFQQRLTLLYADAGISEHNRIYQAAALKDSLAEAEQAYQQVYRDLKNANPRWRDAVMTGGDPVDSRRVQRTLVPDDGLLLLYQIGESGSHLFAVPPGREKVEAFPLEVDEAQAALLGVSAGPLTAALLRGSLNDPVPAAGPGALGWLPRIAHQDKEHEEGLPGEAAVLEAAHALWQILVPEALRARLLAAGEVVLVPDEALHFVPFEALAVEPAATFAEAELWLDAGPVIRYAPSLTTLYHLAQKPLSTSVQTTSILSLSDPIFNPNVVADATRSEGDPTLIADAGASARTRYARLGGTFAPLPGTARETRAIGAVLGRESDEALQVIQGLDATEAALRAALPNKRYLHLATHGWVDAGRNALFASLVLTPPPGATTDLANDGFLQLHEIYDLSLDATELAVLSACETNIGPAVESEGVFALSRGFLAAGARRVIASQWAVDDASTAALVGAFFEAVLDAERTGQPVDYARALRDAKQRVRREARWQAPFYWAPFILIGTS